MIKIGLMLAALIFAATPAALGVLWNNSFARETPVRAPEHSSHLPLQLQRPDPKVDGLDAGNEDLDSRRTER